MGPPLVLPEVPLKDTELLAPPHNYGNTSRCKTATLYGRQHKIFVHHRTLHTTSHQNRITRPSPSFQHNASTANHTSQDPETLQDGDLDRTPWSYPITYPNPRDSISKYRNTETQVIQPLGPKTRSTPHFRKTPYLASRRKHEPQLWEPTHRNKQREPGQGLTHLILEPHSGLDR
eukprot:g25692.t1